MGVLQQAYTFVKKHWSTDDDVFPDDLNRYEDGIDDLYSVTNQTNTNIGNLSNLLSQAKSNIVTAINEIVTNLQSEIETRGNTDTELERKINDLSNTKSEYIGKAFVSDEILLDATYPIAYCGSVGNSSTMPNTGQFRVQYIPYFANNEGYSVQIAWGVVTNSGLWYRVASGTRWEKWESFSTTTKTDISSLLNGWTCNASFPNVVIQKTGNIATMTAVLQDGVKTAGTQLCVLPAGYRPTQGFKALMVAYADASLVNQEMVRVSIGTGGTITIDTPFTQKYLSINLTYPV